jgi:hypothetical protein
MLPWPYFMRRINRMRVKCIACEVYAYITHYTIYSVIRNPYSTCLIGDVVSCVYQVNASNLMFHIPLRSPSVRRAQRRLLRVSIASSLDCVFV